MADKRLDERDQMTRRILSDAPRLTASDQFKFSCQPGISCFNACCADVNILLTPLDIVRLGRRLEMKTSDFLARHTFVPFNEESKLPFVFLKMKENEKKTCPFVTEAGCGVYQDRPWPCRMYPVGEASPEDSRVQGDGFFFLIEEDHCKGGEEDKEWTVKQWMQNQGVSEYEQLGKLYRDILLHPHLQKQPLDPARMEMFYMACYDLDKFRDFVFNSKFLTRFSLEDQEVEKIGSDDIELLKFAFRWLRFALFGEMTVELNQELLSERERDMLENKIIR